MGLCRLVVREAIKQDILLLGVGVGARMPVPVSQKDRVLEGWVPLPAQASPTAQGLHPSHSASENSSCVEKFSLPDHVLILSSCASENQEGKAFAPILQMQLVKPGQEQRAQNHSHLTGPSPTNCTSRPGPTRASLESVTTGPRGLLSLSGEIPRWDH